MGDLLDLPPIDETMGDAPQKTAVALAVGQAIDLEKVDLEKLALAQFGDWRQATDKLKADHIALVMDLSTQSKIDEAKSLRERTINKPLAEARRIAKALKSKLNATSKAVGTELEAIESAYDGAAAPLTKLIEDAQEKLNEKKEAERLAEEKRLTGLRARVDEIMAAWVARCQIEGMTAERVNAGIAGLQAVVMPPDLADVTAYWSTSKTATVATMQQIHDQLERERLAKLKQQIDGATEQIKAIQQQPIIAHHGRLGVRQGGTIDCIRETLAETEAWPIDEAAFGPLMPAAQIAKDGAVAAIKQMLAERLQRDAEDRDIDCINDFANDCVARGSQYIKDSIREFDEVVSQAVSKAARVQVLLAPARARMVAALEEAERREAAERAASVQAEIDAKSHAALAQQETTPPADAGGTPPAVAAGADAAPGAAGEAENPGQEPEAAPITGAAPGLLQDDSRGLSMALASRPDAMLHAREAAAAIADDLGPLETGEADALEPAAAPPAAPETPTIKLGALCTEVGPGFNMTAEFVRSLGFEPDGREKAAMLYTPTKRRQILLALAKRLQEIA